MKVFVSQSTHMELSICITTFNRAAFIGSTLESILGQMTDDCEIVVLDAASSDDTERVVSEYAQHFDRLRYVKQDANRGIDRDYDRAVELACGRYCWLMPDDDLLRPGAVAAVLDVLRCDPSLIVVNSEIRNRDMSKVLLPRMLDFEATCVYGPEEFERMFVEVGNYLWYIGGIIVARSIWLEREKEQYYGSSWTYLGVILQKPLPGKTLVIAEPFISYRMGNTHTYTPRHFEVMMINLPSLLWSLTVSEPAKRKVCRSEPWRDFRLLLVWRGLGHYTFSEYQQLLRPRLPSARDRLVPILVALLPGVLVMTFFLLYCAVAVRAYHQDWPRAILLESLRRSRFHFRNWGVFARTVLACSRTVGAKSHRLKSCSGDGTNERSQLADARDGDSG